MSGFMARQFTDIKNLAIESINSRFAFGEYCKARVMVDRTTGYVNGTHLAATGNADRPKRIEHWLQAISTSELLEFLAKDREITSDFVMRYESEAGELDGTNGVYIHPRLITSLMQWVNPAYADIIGGVVHDRAVDGYSDCNGSEIGRKLAEIGSRVERLTEEMAELKAYARTASVVDEQVLYTLDKISGEASTERRENH